MSSTQRKQQQSEETLLSEEALSLKSNSQLIERDAIENTPFEMLKENELFYITWGAYKLTEGNGNWAYTMNLLETEKWLITSRMIFASQHAAEQLKKQKHDNKDN